MPRQNVLLIVVDQWRGDTLPMTGHPLIRTPNIAALAAEGVTFTRHYTQAVPCGPGRASLLTGQYMMNHRAVQNTVPLDARHTNLAKEVRKAGYQPALVGYTTTTPDPRVTPHGDPRFRVLGYDMDGWHPVGSWGLQMEAYFAWLAMRGFPVPAMPTDIWLPQDAEEGHAGPSARPSHVPAELSDSTWFTDRALEYLHGVAGQSWLLHLGYWRPHPPFTAPAPYHEMYAAADCPPPLRADSVEEEAAQHPLLRFYLDNVQRKSFFERAGGRGCDMSIAEVQQMRASYYGLMSEVDAQLGRVFDHLKASGQWDDTLIILTSDHAEQLGDHHLLGKLGYFDQSYHIPLVIRDPRAAANGSRGTLVSAATETIDTMPTSLDWLGLDRPRSCDGHSLLPFLYENATPDGWRDALHYEFDFRNVYYSQPESALGLAMDDCSLAVVQDEDWKYVHFAALPPLLFNLRTDPGQFRDLAQDPAHAPQIARYAQKMLDWRLRHAEKTLTGYAASPDGLTWRER